MATANPSFLEAINSAPQPLYTIDQDQFGHAVYNSVGNATVIQFDSTGHSDGAAISLDNATGVFTCAAGQKYQFTVTLELINMQIDPNNKPKFAIIEPDTGNIVSAPFDVNQTLTAITTPGADQPYVVVIGLPNESLSFPYPATVVNAHIVVQAIAGYTVA